jgi:glycosyltransferase involved in cell wall biosynthesis
VLEIIESTSAGVGKHVVDLVRHLDLEEFDLAIAYSPLRADSLFLNGIGQAACRGVRTFEVPMRREVSLAADAESFQRLRRLLERERFDIVHTHGSKAGFLGRIAARCVRPAPVALYTPHAISLSFSRKYWVPEKLAGLATDALLAVSPSEASKLERFHLVPAAKLHCVTAGIDIANIQAAGSVDQGALRRELEVPAESTIVGTVGRIAFQKDPSTFLRALPLVRERGDKAYFVWIGDGEQRTELEKEAKRLGMDGHIRFLGYRADVPRLMAGFDIFALTSRYESFGYVTCEAMGLGKPVVASRVDGTIELVENGVTGFLFEPGDAGGLADQVSRLIQSSHLRRQMGEAGLKRVERNFRLERMIADTETLYRKLLAARGWAFSPSATNITKWEMS